MASKNFRFKFKSYYEWALDKLSRKTFSFYYNQILLAQRYNKIVKKFYKLKLTKEEIEIIINFNNDKLYLREKQENLVTPYIWLKDKKKEILKIETNFNKLDVSFGNFYSEISNYNSCIKKQELEELVENLGLLKEKLEKIRLAFTQSKDEYFEVDKEYEDFLAQKKRSKKETKEELKEKAKEELQNYLQKNKNEFRDFKLIFILSCFCVSLLFVIFFVKSNFSLVNLIIAVFSLLLPFIIEKRVLIAKILLNVLATPINLTLIVIDVVLIMLSSLIDVVAFYVFRKSIYLTLFIPPIPMFSIGAESWKVILLQTLKEIVFILILFLAWLPTILTVKQEISYIYKQLFIFIGILPSILIVIYVINSYFKYIVVNEKSYEKAFKIFLVIITLASLILSIL